MSGSKIRLYGSTSGYVELAAPAVAPDSVLTLPALAGGFGKVAQVVSTTKTDSWSESVGGTTISGDVTGLTVTITPAAATSKLVIVAQASFGVSTGIGGVILYRDASAILVGDAASNRRRSTTARHSSVGGEDGEMVTIFGVVDASAATATTFSVRIVNASGSSGTAYVNRSATDSDNLNNFRSASSITAIEVAA